MLNPSIDGHNTINLIEGMTRVLLFPSLQPSPRRRSSCLGWRATCWSWWRWLGARPCAPPPISTSATWPSQVWNLSQTIPSRIASKMPYTDVMLFLIIWILRHGDLLDGSTSDSLISLHWLLAFWLAPLQAAPSFPGLQYSLEKWWTPLKDMPPLLNVRVKYSYK